jgi:hypothetical protein
VTLAEILAQMRAGVESTRKGLAVIAAALADAQKDKP